MYVSLAGAELSSTDAESVAWLSGAKWTGSRSAEHDARRSAFRVTGRRGPPARLPAEEGHSQRELALRLLVTPAEA